MDGMLFQFYLLCRAHSFPSYFSLHFPLLLLSCTSTSAIHFAFSTSTTKASPLPSFRQQHSSTLPHPTFTTPQPSPSPCNGVLQRGMTACQPATLYWPVCRAGTAASTRPSHWRYDRLHRRRCSRHSVMLLTPPSSSVGEIYLSLQVLYLCQSASITI